MAKATKKQTEERGRIAGGHDYKVDDESKKSGKSAAFAKRR
jgi:hypothetical protein